MMANSITNPDPPENAVIRRQIHHLAVFAALLFSALLVAMVLSFVSILPNWVANASSVAVLPALLFFFARAKSIHRRWRTAQTP